METHPPVFVANTNSRSYPRSSHEVEHDVVCYLLDGDLIYEAS